MLGAQNQGKTAGARLSGFERYSKCDTAVSSTAIWAKMQNLRYVEMRHRGLVYVSGEDAQSFLQSLISNDMGGVDHDTGVYASLLTPQGKYLHDLFICAGGPNVAYLDQADENGDAATAVQHYLVEADRAADLAKRLNMYKLRAKVDVEVLVDWKVIALFGADLYDAPGMRKVAGDTRELGQEGAGGRRMTDPRCPSAGVRCYLPAGDVEMAIAELQAEPGALADFDQTRICLGLPDGCRDIEPEKSTLLENGFDRVGGISWTKGCYVGQEVTARMKYRNLGKKQLFVVDLEGAAPAKGTPVTLAGKSVGELRTSVPGIGLAMLRLDAIDQYRLKGGDFVAGSTHIMPRLDEAEDSLVANAG